MINIQTITPLLFAAIMGVMPMTLTANNSISWNPAPTDISLGDNDITLDYSTDQNSIIVVQFFDENWNPIGQQPQNVSAGSGQVTLILTPDSTPSATNFLQAKLLDNSWSPLAEILQVTVAYTPPMPSNSLAWNPEPTSISIGDNDITLDYSIDQSGIVFVQVFDKDWNKLDQNFQSVSSGTEQITLPLSVSSPSADINYLQAFLFDSGWGDVGAERLDLSLPGEISPPPATNSLTFNPEPTGIAPGNNDFTLDYSIDQDGLIFIQVFDENWNKFDDHFTTVSAGSDQITLSLDVSSPSANNYLQAVLYDANWGDIGVPRIDLTLPGEISPPPATNSLTFNPQPTGISAGNNDFTLDYSIDQDGLIFIQLFDENWNKLDDHSKTVSAGSDQITLSLDVSSPSANNYLQAFLYDSDWGDIGVPRLDLTLPSTYTSDCGSMDGICKIYPDTENQLLAGRGIYEANMYASSEWTGSLIAFWGAPEGVFWAEWDNNHSGSNSSAHEEFDYKALRASWTNDATGNGYPTKISQITDPNLACTANGQWRAGGSGRCHINMTAWIYNYDGDGSRCDVIIHTWDNSGNLRGKYTGGRFTNIGTISDSGVTYDVLRTLPGGLGEKASYNLVPQDGRQNNPLAAFPTNTQYFTVNVKRILDKLIQRENSQGQTITSNWYLDGMEWTITGQSGDNVDGTFVPDSQGKWTFNSYKIPNIPSNSNKVETDIQSINFDITPNPFSHAFNVEYHLPQDQAVSIQLFTQEGKLIKTIKNKTSRAAGNHTETITIDNLPSGMYLLHLTTSDSHGVQKLVKF